MKIHRVSDQIGKAMLDKSKLQLLPSKEDPRVKRWQEIEIGGVGHLVEKHEQEQDKMKLAKDMIDKIAEGMSSLIHGHSVQRKGEEYIVDNKPLSKYAAIKYITTTVPTGSEAKTKPIDEAKPSVSVKLTSEIPTKPIVDEHIGRLISDLTKDNEWHNFNITNKNKIGSTLYRVKGNTDGSVIYQAYTLGKWGIEDKSNNVKEFSDTLGNLPDKSSKAEYVPTKPAAEPEKPTKVKVTIVPKDKESKGYTPTASELQPKIVSAKKEEAKSEVIGTKPIVETPIESKKIESEVKESAKRALPVLIQSFNGLHDAYRNKRGKRSDQDLRYHKRLINELKEHGINIPEDTKLGQHNGLYENGKEKSWFDRINYGIVKTEEEKSSDLSETKERYSNYGKYDKAQAEELEDKINQVKDQMKQLGSIAGSKTASKNRKLIAGYEDDLDKLEEKYKWQESHPVSKIKVSTVKGTKEVEAESKGAWAVVPGVGKEHHVIHTPSGLHVASFKDKDSAHQALNSFLGESPEHHTFLQDKEIEDATDEDIDKLQSHAKRLEELGSKPETKEFGTMNVMHHEKGSLEVPVSESEGSWAVAEHSGKHHIVHKPNELHMASYDTKEQAHNALDKYLKEKPEHRTFGEAKVTSSEEEDKELNTLGEISKKLKG